MQFHRSHVYASNHFLKNTQAPKLTKSENFNDWSEKTSSCRNTLQKEDNKTK